MKFSINSRWKGERTMLIVFEGVHCCGKSTQQNMLVTWLRKVSERNIYKTEWNSFPELWELNDHLKRSELLSNHSYSLIHALDLNLRYECFIKKHLEEGSIVIADRYVFTAYARDIPRGNSIELLDELYSFAPEPDLVFYFRIEPEEVLRRMKSNNRERSIYVWGKDLNFNEDEELNFIEFMKIQDNIYVNQLKKLQKKFVIIDATESIDDQHHQIIRTFNEYYSKDIGFQ